MVMDEYEHYRMQEALKKGEQNNQLVQLAPQMHAISEQLQSALVSQTNPKKVIEEIELILRNQERQPNGSIRVMGKAHMNDLGIHRMLLILRSAVNQNTILSHMEEDIINRIVLQIGDDIIDDLTLHWRKYGIDDKSTLDFIVNAVVFPVYSAYMRSFGQNEKNWLKGITVETISGGRSNLPEKRGGFFDKFKL